MDPDPPTLGVDAELRELRQRADDDFHRPPDQHVPGRHQIDLPGLAYRVSLTRSRYPDRPDGADQYALTVSRVGLGEPPEEAQTRRILQALFGERADLAQERGGGAGAVRMFRIPAEAVPPNE